MEVDSKCIKTYIVCMNRLQLARFLRFLDLHDQWIFTTQMAGVYFKESDNTLRHGLARHVHSGALMRLAKGVYANPDARSRPIGYVLEDMIKHLRPDEFSYVSLESRLSEFGVISQVPARLTVITTGRSQLFQTPMGTIEFTHTTRSVEILHPRTKYSLERRTFLASPVLAYEDLRHVGRNLGLVDLEELDEAQANWESLDEPEE